MKFRKLQQVLAQLPQLQNSIGPSMVVSAPLNYSSTVAEKVLKNWTREHIEFVAFRPFDTLDLNLRSTSNSHRLVHHPRNTEHCPVYAEKSTRFFISAHLEGDAQGTRAVFVDFGKSIGAALQEFREWHEKSGHKKKLVVEYILKTVRTGVNKDKSTIRETYEIFLADADQVSIAA